LYPRHAYAGKNGGQSGQKESIPLSRIKRSTGVNSSVNPSNNNTPQNPLRGIFNTPWGIALGSGVAALIFIILPIFLISRSMTVPSSGTKSIPSTPTATSPAAIPSESNTPTPPPAANPAATAPTVTATATTEPLMMEVGKAIVKEGTLNPAQSIVYTIPLQVGQQLKATLTANPPGATMNILAPNQANVDVFAKNTVNWQGNLPLSGEYRIEIVSPPGSAASNYKLDAILSNASPSTPPSVTPVAAPSTIPTHTPVTTP
jgi:hypothetical protein